VHLHRCGESLWGIRPTQPTFGLSALATSPGVALAESQEQHKMNFKTRTRIIASGLFGAVTTPVQSAK
jgi:hypothetical protein